MKLISNGRGVSIYHLNRGHSYNIVNSMHTLNVLNTFYTGFYIKEQNLSFYINKLFKNKFKNISLRKIPNLKDDFINQPFELLSVIVLFAQYFFPKSIYLLLYNLSDQVSSFLIIRHMNKHRPRILIHFQKDSTLALKVKKKYKDIIIIKDISTPSLRYQISSLQRFLKTDPRLLRELNTLKKLLISNEAISNINDYYISPSEVVKKSLMMDGIAESKIHKIPYGSNFNQSEKTFKIQSEKLELLFVGRISMLKGVNFLLESLATYQHRERFNLTLVGDLKQNPELINRYPMHKFLGVLNRDEVMKLMDKLDALIFPSLFEGLPYSILEAISRGMLVICSSDSSMNELLTDEYQFIFNTYDENSLHEKLDLLLSSHHEKSIRILDNLRKELTWKNYENEISSFIKTIL